MKAERRNHVQVIKQKEAIRTRRARDKIKQIWNGLMTCLSRIQVRPMALERMQWKITKFRRGEEQIWEKRPRRIYIHLKINTRFREPERVRYLSDLSLVGLTKRKTFSLKMNSKDWRNFPKRVEADQDKRPNNLKAERLRKAVRKDMRDKGKQWKRS